MNRLESFVRIGITIRGGFEGLRLKSKFKDKYKDKYKVKFEDMD